MVGIITLKQQKFSQSDPVLIRQLKKNCSLIQSWSGQNWLKSWSPHKCHENVSVCALKLVIADCCLVSISVATGSVSLTSDCCLFRHNLTSNFHAAVSYKLNASINKPNKAWFSLWILNRAKHRHLIEKSFIIYVKCWSQRSEESFISLTR